MFTDNTRSADLTNAAQGHAPFVARVSRFAAARGFEWLRSKSRAIHIGNGKVIFLETFKAPNGSLQGHFGFAQFDDTFTEIVSFGFDESTVPDETFAFFSEFFGFDDTFTADRFAVFSRRL